MADKRKPIGFVTATVRFPIYDGDKALDREKWDWFVFEEPGITAKHSLGVTRRNCETLDSKFEEIPPDGEMA